MQTQAHISDHDANVKSFIIQRMGDVFQQLSYIPDSFAVGKHLARVQ